MSLRTASGPLLEMVHRPKEMKTALVVFRDGEISEHASVALDGHEYGPYSPENSLLTHRVIVLPSEVCEYDSDATLAMEVQEFIHRYVDLSPAFEEIAANYVLLTWGYDTFNELPYLRVRGQYGSGKSRFLLTVGSLCYKPIFASGASTVSPIFRLLDEIGGTLVIDEADFWASDERTEIVKILNNGNARGFPVLRSELTPQKEFSPRAFNIFGPKIVATRHRFEDAALESRCLTEVLGGRPLRQGISIGLPRSFEREAEGLRNKLLSYRLHRFSTSAESSIVLDPELEPRRAQIIAPLLSVVATDDAKVRILSFVTGGLESSQGRSPSDPEQEVLACVNSILGQSPSTLTLAAVAKQFDEMWGARYRIEVTPRWVGAVLRRLSIRPQKSNGVYVIPTSEYPRLHDLFAEHGISEAGAAEDPAAASINAGGNA